MQQRLSPHALCLTAALALFALAAVPAGAQVSPTVAGPVFRDSGAALSLTVDPLRTFTSEESRRRPARLGDLALLYLGGVGGGLAAGAVAVAVDPPVVARVLIYGLGVGAGTALTGRLLDVDGSALGAVALGLVGSGVVLLAAGDINDDGGGGLDAAAGAALLALTVPPILAAGGYVLTPTLLGPKSPGLALRVDL